MRPKKENFNMYFLRDSGKLKALDSDKQIFG